VQAPNAPGGRFPKSEFRIDLDAGTVSCPAGNTVALTPAGDGQLAKFGLACAGCPLAAKCTTAASGRTVYVGPYEQQLARARARQKHPDWKADYNATRPKVTADFSPLAAAVNLARLRVLGLVHNSGTRGASTT
jgi:hypothetical protein